MIGWAGWQSGTGSHSVIQPFEGDATRALLLLKGGGGHIWPASQLVSQGAMSNMPVLFVTCFPSGEAVPVLGQGTWTMGVDARRRKEEIASLRLGIDLGMTLIDTAEMYADGGAEKVVGQAIAGRRNEVFLVSKVLPEHATRRGTIVACERSLRRLRTDRLDLFLLHWREEIPLSETLEAFDKLLRAGKIRYWGVSNFDLNDMQELVGSRVGAGVAANEVMYNVKRRGIEYALMPWCRRRNITIIAYSPLDQGQLVRSRTLKDIALRHDATPAQVALAWLVRQKGVIAIPKAKNQAHLRENRAALDLRLDKHDLATLDRVFPPPRKKKPLETT
jgi:diketogulonate reductase-like aldo/keto reductase